MQEFGEVIYVNLELNYLNDFFLVKYWLQVDDLYIYSVLVLEIWFIFKVLILQ